jgi:HSP20 family protein
MVRRNTRKEARKCSPPRTPVPKALPTEHPLSGLPLSVWQDEADVYIEADMPGFKSDQIEISVEARTLMIGGERNAERQGEGFDNRLYGRFEQKVLLPIDVQSDQADARLECGVLKLTLPRSEALKPRKIAVKAARGR